MTTRRTEYGGVPWYLLFAIAASIAVGYGAYRVLHAKRIADAEAAARAPKPAPSPKPAADTGGPALELGEPRVIDGQVEVADVAAAVGSVRGVRRCFARTHAAGSVELALVIDGNGNVVSSTATSNTFDRDITDCIERAIKNAPFPRTSDGGEAIVTMPIEKR